MRARLFTVLLGLAPIPHSYLPESHPFYNESVTQYPFDPEGGRALLESVGWTDPDEDGLRTNAGDRESIPPGTPLRFS